MKAPQSHAFFAPRIAALLTLIGCGSGQTLAGKIEPQEAVRADASAVETALSPSDRADRLLAQMTLEEKLAYIGGDRDFYIRPIARLGIPEIKMSDGPAGCRNWGPNTAFPAAIALAASFDEALAERVGRRIGHDCRARGVHILLAPGMNIQRSPLNGRNFEYLGEDPLLAGTMASAFIRGVQSEGVLCTAKHFAGNNQEWDRNHISSEIDERSLREIYLPAFERSVRTGRVGAVMTAYNLLNGTFCSHHPWLLRQVLEQEWGFSGLVMSDWGAVHDGLAAATAGLDLEMPRGAHMNEAALSPLLAEKKLDVAVIDDKVRRILRAIAGAGFLDRPQKRDDIPLDDPMSRADALDAAHRGLVLLKNAGAVLPLDLAQTRRIAVIGPNADPAVVGGSGSAFVTALHPTSLLDGLRQVATGVTVLHHPGLGQSSEMGALGKPCFTGPVEEEVFAGRELEGASIGKRSVDRINLTMPDDHAARGLPVENFSVRWTGTVSASKKGNYRIMTKADDGVRVLFDGKTIIDDWHDHAPKVDEAKIDLAGGKHRVVVEYYQAGGGAVAQFAFARTPERVTFEGEKEVSSIAREADAVVVAVGFGQSADTNSWRTAFPPYWPPDWARAAGLVESEDSDRPFELPPAQIETIKLVAAANPRTIVIVDAGGPVDVGSFVARVPALLYAWYPGQEGGRAIADILFGSVSPSGKLPVTFGKRYADYPSAASYQVKLDHKTPYSEGVFVGYRGFDRDQLEPAFPFGHGIGYTTFEYTNLAATPNADGGATVTFTVANSGKRGGEEVAEVYVGAPKPKVPRPPKELKGFARVSLAPGERQEVRLVLEPRAFAYWDDARKEWAVDAGSFEIAAGASSRDIRLRAKIDVRGQTLRP